MMSNSGQKPFFYLFLRFETMILPQANTYLVQKAKLRESLAIKYPERLHSSVERKLSHLLEQIALAYRNILILQKNLTNSYDFHLKTCFDSLDEYGLGYLSSEQ